MSGSKKTYLRFSWSHQARIHRLIVKYANFILKWIPFGIKYSIGKRLCRNKPPYNLIEGKTVVQIGAPDDTLQAGRSRGMYLSILAGPRGRVLIIEPDPISVTRLKETLRRQRIKNTRVIWSGAWSSYREIELFVNRRHPATNFTGGTVKYDEKRLKEYEKMIVKADTLDNILDQEGVEHVDLVSITTNWAELEILKGMKEVINSGLEYICLAYGNPGTDYIKLMDDLGYLFFANDDRGMTFKRKALI